MALVDYVDRVLADTTLLSIVSAFYGGFGVEVRILTLNKTWLTANAPLVQQHRSAAMLQLASFEGSLSRLVQCAAIYELEVSVPAECRLRILSMPAGVPGRDLADFLSGAVLAVTGHEEAAQNPTQGPCLACSIRTTEAGASEAVVSFRTEVAASVAFEMDGLPCRSVLLVILRRADFGVGGSSDPWARLQFNAI